MYIISFSLLSVADVDWEVGASHDGGMTAGLPQRMKGVHQLGKKNQCLQ